MHLTKLGAKTLNATACSIMTLVAECLVAVKSIIMLGDILLSVVVLSVVMLSDVNDSVVTLNVTILCDVDVLSLPTLNSLA